ncbi:MAG: methyltransferase domain-containing protein [Actinobacteria bacterium]|nr:methyltransferase domain-containing protein [Actinomycetota bacterium]NIS35434.1 methyltransferase domain-containing protein [Actinomycetota bacterium]NIT98127.1 methyltransferase domain-containing protein [Actinomycetota bacterium]NIU21754.1 methyltransferase domain-containing protein [Actinomycetota bacterium]NIU70114.1 methyltransferase domain-containing protein [Actinomycetota bacterium]
MTDDIERFRQRYRISHEEALLAAERAALGSDYGGNGYTTMEQAEEIGRRLALGPADVLLDIGAGCGWPGLHLASTLGCAVISTDPIPEGMVVARRRSIADRIDDRSWAVSAGAEAIPLRPGSVDAVIHTDVLC